MHIPILIILKFNSIFLLVKLKFEIKKQHKSCLIPETTDYMPCTGLTLDLSDRVR